MVVLPLPPLPPPVLPPPPPPAGWLGLPLNRGCCPEADRAASIPNSAPRLPPMGMAMRPALSRSFRAIVRTAVKEKGVDSCICDSVMLCAGRKNWQEAQAAQLESDWRWSSVDQVRGLVREPSAVGLVTGTSSNRSRRLWLNQVGKLCVSPLK